MLGLAKTCMKLQLSFYDFIGDRLGVPGPKIPDLATLVRPAPARAKPRLPGNSPRLQKELVGAYENGGTDYRPHGCPDRVEAHDFADDELGKVAPYGVYDIAANAGCVSVGIDHDTAQFAVNSIRRWLDVMGRERHPACDRLMITADGGGSNGSRVRLFKVELQKLADETGLALQVCRYPPGTSKWNKIERRLFRHITQTWRGKPLTRRPAVVELIAATTTTAGLTVRCELDTRTYPKGIKVSDAKMAALNLTGNAFHPEWNYTISPTAPP